jgi:hypothetical protein
MDNNFLIRQLNIALEIEKYLNILISILFFLFSSNNLFLKNMTT